VGEAQNGLAHGKGKKLYFSGPMKGNIFEGEFY
jgi:hypothetical protein